MNFRSGATVEVVDTTSGYSGAFGSVISTSTRDGFQLVGVQIAKLGTIWFLSSQLKSLK
jgi:hypothetical protein